MYKNRRTRLAAGAVVLALVAVGLNASAAQAEDIPGWFTPNARNSSDPSIMPCTYRNNGQSPVETLCMYTSSDMATRGYTPDNYYPMSETYLYMLKPGSGIDPGIQSNWYDEGVMFKESWYPWVKPRDAQTDANHLWAPTAARGRDGNYYLYVPDISGTTTTEVHTESHIGVSMSIDPRGPFNYQKQLTYNGLGVAGYASDPTVMSTVHAPISTASTTWIAWANGDYETCGNFSVARLDDIDMSTLLTAPRELAVVELPAGMDTCTRSGGFHGTVSHAYMEGPELYDVTGLGLPGPFMLLFAIKPNSNPSGCSSSNEAIAYATGTDPLLPFTYRGIVMCGSTTQWTNQASLHAYRDSGSAHYLVAYHDAPTSGVIPQNRHAHIGCLPMFAGAGPLLTRANNFSSCMGTRGGQYNWKEMIYLR